MQTLATLFVAILIMPACYRNCLPTNEVKDRLNRQLHVGDTREKIEAVLKDIVSAYDRRPPEEDRGGKYFNYVEFVKRYSTTIRDEPGCGSLQGISIFIYLDDQDRLSRIEVSEFYTWW
ncbi:MAG: hypothetical protein AB1649_06020 [Chloroflexota bacterium]